MIHLWPLFVNMSDPCPVSLEGVINQSLTSKETPDAEITTALPVGLNENLIRLRR